MRRLFPSIDRALLTQLLDQPLSAYWRIVLDPSGLSEINFDGRHALRSPFDTFHLEGLPR
jgi:hypothetical protein